MLVDSFDLWSTSMSERASTRGRSSANSGNIYGVQKLRELILQLAVSGRLTTAANSLRSANENLSDQSKAEPFIVPSGWVWKSLREVGRVSTGKTPDTRNSNFYIGTTPFIGPGQLSMNHRILKSDKFISKEAELNTSIALPGSILMVCIGGSIGKSAIATHRVAFNQQINAIQTTDCNVEFIHMCLRAKFFLERVHQLSSGSATPIINKSRWENIQIPIPPIGQQNKIVEKVNALMQLCDQLERDALKKEIFHDNLVIHFMSLLLRAESIGSFQDNWSEVSQLFDELFISEQNINYLRGIIIDLALEGKISLQDSSKDTLVDFLELCRKNACHSSTKRGRKLNNASDFQSDKKGLHQIPESWSWIRLSELASFENGDRSKNYPSRDQFVAAGMAFINAGHLQEEGIDYSNMNFIDVETYDNLRSGKIKEGDILFCLRGSLGKFAIVKNGETGAIASSLVIIRPFAPEIVDYLGIYFSSTLAKDQILKFDNGTAQPNLAGADLGHFQVPLPPLSEQKAIVASLKRLLALCDQLSESFSKARQLECMLADSFVDQALS
ncbi:restriction modification system DNA specificity domain protein [Polynucleobacter asymbioticus QLW-P1DMWA-1]|uniref:Restriction modification system DNA specificity domain protein n=2 Tax=Polynucleobacter asymbioticus TaxID=576611 RepID=A4SXY4_POLAQ|nr:restriction modification system DNA specificity domain protein [Polynucleobacter asymbioticus QLW-P1DMWA-1]